MSNSTNRFSAKNFFSNQTPTKTQKPNHQSRSNIKKTQSKQQIQKQRKHIPSQSSTDLLVKVAQTIQISQFQQSKVLQRISLSIKKYQQKQTQKQTQIEAKKSLIVNEKPKTGKNRAKIFLESRVEQLSQQIKTSIHRWKYGQGTTPSKLVIGNWNVNGIRSVISKKMIFPYINNNKPDILCITETKADQKNFDSSPITFQGYQGYWNFPKHSSGYSGVAVFSKFMPRSATQDILGKQYREYSQEGRILTLEFQAFILINIYVPTVGKDLERIDYRKRYDSAFRQHVKSVRNANPSKPVLIVGDLNVAHTELDTHPGKQIMLTPSFTTIERQGFQQLLNMGYTDVYRALHPGVRAYTWWYVNIGGRDKLDSPGLGRRIDYFLMPTQYMKWVKRCDILREYLGADHCPVQIEIDTDL